MTPPSPPTSREGFKVAIICALPLEAEYVQFAFDKCWDESKQYSKAPGDQNAYTTGVIGEHNVVLAHMPGLGGNAAAAVAAGLRSSFLGIQLALVVGICGAIPNPMGTKDEIVLGDVIISTAVIQYDFGRHYPNGFKRKRDVEDSLGRAAPEIQALIAKLKTRPHLKRLQAQLGDHLRQLQIVAPEAKYPGAALDHLYEPSYIHQHRVGNDSCEKCKYAVGTCPKSCDELKCEKNKRVIRKRFKHPTPLDSDTISEHWPSIHFGRFGSANTVMKSGAERDQIAKAEGIIALEMEGAGVWDHFPTVVIKAACDYADSHKNKEWQEYAAATAAACTKAFLGEWVTPNQLLGQDEPSKSIFYVPFDRGQEFVGRIDELRSVEEKISQLNSRRIVSVLGLGGIGKSRLALEIAYRIHSEQPEYSVFWIQATEQLTFEKDMLEIGKKLRIPGVEDHKADIKTLVKLRLSEPSLRKWLLILDNADDEAIWTKNLDSSNDKNSLVDYLPRTISGSILITTRSRRVAEHLTAKEMVELHEMLSDEAYYMFTSRLHNPELATDRIKTLILMEKLAHLPLAIVQAISFINMTKRPVQTYLDLLDKPEAEVIKLLSKDFGDPFRYSNARNPVATTWFISFEHINRNHPLAAKYLWCMACLHEKNIPQSLLPEAESEIDMIDAIAVLEGYSFVSRQTDRNSIADLDKLYDMHRLVQLATRSWLKINGQLLDYTKFCLRQVARLFPTRDYNHKSTWTVYLPHSQYLCAESDGEDLPERYLLLEKIGLCFFVDGKYDDAVKVHSTVVAWRERKAGILDEQTLKAYNNLGEALTWQGDWSAAETYLQQALIGRRKILGQGHPDTLTSQANLACTYSNQGRWKEAEELEVQVMETSSRVLGHEHPDTLISQGNLACTYRKQGRWKEAEELEVQVMETSNRVLGQEHPDTLISQASLACTYWTQGRWKEAEELEVQVMETRNRVLGQEHPDTLASMNNLAWTLKVQGRTSEAIRLMRQCLDISVRKLGKSHPNTRISEKALEAWQEERQDNIL